MLENISQAELFVLLLCFSFTDLIEELGVGDIDDLEGRMANLIKLFLNL